MNQIDTEKTFDQAVELVLDRHPNIAVVSPAYGDCDGVAFRFKGINYEFYDFEELEEFTNKGN